MSAVFIAIFLVMAVMIYFITVALRIVAENASKKVNTYFLGKLEDFDKDFDEKLKKLEELRLEKMDMEESIRILEMDHITLEASRFYQPRPIIRDNFIPIAHYIDNNFFEDYKKVKKLLEMDKAEIIRTIMEKFPYVGDFQRFTVAQSMLNALNDEALYDLCSFTSREQLRFLNEELKGDANKLLEEFVQPLTDAEDFDCLELYNWLKQIVREESPYLMAYLGEEEEDYSHVSPYVICQYDKNVCEGIRVIYQNKLYDYSVYESRKKNERIY